MYRLILITYCISQSITLYSQRKFDDAFKINLSGLIIKNISVQYERKISKRLTVALNYRNLPYGTVPFYSNLSKLASNSSIDFSKMNLGSSAITPELRLYDGRKGALRGFYLAPFISFSKYKTDFPISFSDRYANFTGSMKNTTGGLQIGTQMKISRRFYLDWWILGPNIGKGNGNLVMSTKLTVSEQSSLNDKLAQLKNDVPFNFIESYSVNSTGAVIVLHGPWAGIRALAFNLSFHFSS